MAKGVMGKTALEAAFKNYVKNFKEKGSVKHEDLLAELDKAYVEGALKNHLMKWITQKGYPVLTVSRDYDLAAPPEKITYTQSRFLLSGTTDTDSTWDIPFSLTNGVLTPGPSPSLSEPKKHVCWFTSATGKKNQHSVVKIQFIYP